jgi:hypothetical protein
MKIEATKSFRYASVNRESGDVFETNERDGKILCAIGKAKPVKARVKKAVQEEAKAEQPKRAYRRRDMRAE